MKTTDLMIGDWVCVAKNFAQKYHRVRALSNDENDVVKGIYINDYGVECNSIFSCNDLEPIPLTPEILEKNGFAKDDKNDNMYYWNWSITDNCVSYDKETNVFRIFHTLGNLVFVHPLSYVHELQHALKLCGIKKEIEL